MSNIRSSRSVRDILRGTEASVSFDYSFYIPKADMLIYRIAESDYYAKRVNKLLSILTSEQDGKFVGALIMRARASAEALPGHTARVPVRGLVLSVAKQDDPGVNGLLQNIGRKTIPRDIFI